MANIYRSALQLLEDLSSGTGRDVPQYGPSEYADLLAEGQNRVGVKTEGHGEEGYVDYHARRSRFKDLLRVPSGETAYQTQSINDPVFALARAIEDYTGSSSGFMNTPFRRRKVEQLANSADYQDPHVKKQVEANTLASYLGDNTLKKIAALSKSFYPAPADFVTWRGIQPSSTTMKKHYEHLGPKRSLKDVEQDLAIQRTFLDNWWADTVEKYGGGYDKWPKDVQEVWNTEVGKQNTLGNEYQSLQYGGSSYFPAPVLEKFPLYDDYGSEAFLSTSVDRPSARSFAEDDRGMFRILVPEGTPIRPVFPYSSHDSEMEVLLPPRSLYRRTGERTKAGDVPLLYIGRGRPKSDKYIGAALPLGLGAGAAEYEDAEQ